MNIHPTAVVSPAARLGEGVRLGPHAVIDGNVTLGDGVVVGANCVVTGHTVLGEGVVLHPGAVVGCPPQDLSYKGEPTEVIVGPRTVLREHATIHAGTVKGRGRTVVGADCFLMAGAHVGHDCIVGDGVILSNNVLLAGHVTLGDYVLIGGGAAIVQRVRIGAYAFISGLSGVTKDVVPYAYVIGHRGRIDGINLIGLKRRGFGREAMRTVLDAYAILFAEEGLYQERLERLTREKGEDALIRPILDFIGEGNGRPLLQPLVQGSLDPVTATDLLESGE